MGRKKLPSTVYEALEEAALDFEKVLEEYENSFENEFFKEKVKNIRREHKDNLRMLKRLLDHLEVAKKEIVLMTESRNADGTRKYRIERLHELKRERFIDAILAMDIDGKDEVDVSV